MRINGAMGLDPWEQGVSQHHKVDQSRVCPRQQVAAPVPRAPPSRDDSGGGCDCGGSDGGGGGRGGEKG